MLFFDRFLGEGDQIEHVLKRGRTLIHDEVGVHGTDNGAAPSCALEITTFNQLTRMTPFRIFEDTATAMPLGLLFKAPLLVMLVDGRLIDFGGSKSKGAAENYIAWVAKSLAPITV